MFLDQDEGNGRTGVDGYIEFIGVRIKSEN